MWRNILLYINFKMDKTTHISLSSWIGYITDWLLLLRSNEISAELKAWLIWSVSLLKNIIDENSSVHKNTMLPTFDEKWMEYSTEVKDIALLAQVLRQQKRFNDDFAQEIHWVLQDLWEVQHATKQEREGLRDRLREACIILLYILTVWLK